MVSPDIVRCTRAHSKEILAIFNDAIVNSTALYEYEPRTDESMRVWFDAKERGYFPVIGALAKDGSLSGFATYGTFRAFPAYKHTVEHSVYVHPARRGHGVGKQLLRELIAVARSQDYHTLVGVIDSANTASIRLHQSFGFSCVGTLREVGYKFDRWLDVEIHQLVLPRPQAH
ncbi:MAG: GNAT family N-acetyltransferase [Nibricoccus sp.]